MRFSARIDWWNVHTESTGSVCLLNGIEYESGWERELIRNEKKKDKQHVALVFLLSGII